MFRNIVREINALKFRHNEIKRGKLAYRLYEFLSIFM